MLILPTSIAAFNDALLSAAAIVLVYIMLLINQVITIVWTEIPLGGTTKKDNEIPAPTITFFHENGPSSDDELVAEE